MSATEIIEQIKKLPREEREKIVVYLQTQKNETGDRQGIQYAADDKFQTATDAILRERAELFRKLAQ